MKTIIYRIILFALVIGAIGVLIWYTSRPQPLSVNATKVVKGTVEATVSNTRAGTVKACRRARLAPAVGGQIARLFVKKGDHVASGQLLLSLWNDDLEAQKQLAQQENSAARASADQVCLLTDNAHRETKRLAELRKNGQVSEQQADTARAKAEAQKAGCQAARTNIAVSAA